MPSVATDNLHDRLVRAALELLKEEGLSALTLRSLARRTGVSHNAPLRHFRSLTHLRSVVAAHGFALLGRAIDESSASLPPGIGAPARLSHAGRAYVRCAVEHPELFELMFRSDHIDHDVPELATAAREAFEHLLRHVRAAQDAGWHRDRDTGLLAASIWASMHGLASLWAQGAITGPVPTATLDELHETLDDILGGTP